MSLFRFTGNPFVDTGLCVVAHLIHKEDAGSVSLDDIRLALEDGNLAEWNSRLKSFTMIFGTNGPLMQSSYKSVDRCALYTAVLKNILDEQEKSTSTITTCELCGSLSAVDITPAFQKALADFALNAKGIKVVGRDLMPMAGSPGNCAQSLPGSVQALNVCARCLVAVNFLPLGSQLVEGRLATYECANQPLARKIVGRIVQDNVSQLRAGNGKVEIPGGKQRPESVLQRLVGVLAELRPDEQGNVQHPLFVWLYSNSGQATDCGMMEIPSFAVRFLWDAVGRGYRKDVEKLLASESKLRAEWQLLPSLRDKRLYPSLLPGKGRDGASLGLAQLYLNQVCGVDPCAFNTARRIAEYIIKDPKVKKELQKEGCFRDASNRAFVRHVVADLAEAGEICLSDYNMLFPTVNHQPIRVDSRGWDILRLHICKYNENDEQELEAFPQMKNMHPKIEEASKLYFEDYVKNRGIARFKQDILNRYQRGGIDVVWLKGVFERLAVEYPGFDYGDWQEFVCDENGKPQAQELLFQMRLRLANLYREKMNGNKETEE